MGVWGTSRRAPQGFLVILLAHTKVQFGRVLWSVAVYVRDVRFTAVILFDPGEEVCEGHEAVVIAVPTILLRFRVGALHDRTSFTDHVVRGSARGMVCPECSWGRPLHVWLRRRRCFAQRCGRRNFAWHEPLLWPMCPWFAVLFAHVTTRSTQFACSFPPFLHAVLPGSRHD